MSKDWVKLKNGQYMPRSVYRSLRRRYGPKPVKRTKPTMEAK